MPEPSSEPSPRLPVPSKRILSVRQIGTLPKGRDPKIFSDYLLTLGIKTRADEQPDGWNLWVYNEDQVPRRATSCKAT